MPVLEFLCPTTYKYFDSGVRLDERSASASRLQIVRTVCPKCGREHRFLVADGLLESTNSFGTSTTQSDQMTLPDKRAATIRSRYGT